MPRRAGERALTHLAGVRDRRRTRRSAEAPVAARRQRHLSRPRRVGGARRLRPDDRRQARGAALRRVPTRTTTSSSVNADAGLSSRDAGELAPVVGRLDLSSPQTEIQRPRPLRSIDRVADHRRRDGRDGRRVSRARWRSQQRTIFALNVGVCGSFDRGARARHRRARRVRSHRRARRRRRRGVSHARGD